MAVFTRILVPVDGSDASDAAVELAAMLAHDVAAKELCFCYVVDVEAEYRDAAALDAGPDAQELIEETEHEGHTYVERATARSAAAGIPSTAVVLEGEPPEAIAKLAREHAIDLIVVGTHRHKAIERLLFGSTAEKIMRHTDVPVLMVKR
jgi:nucleotide-binding universal stress UspA family protein